MLQRVMNICVWLEKCCFALPSPLLLWVLLRIFNVPNQDVIYFMCSDLLVYLKQYVALNDIQWNFWVISLPFSLETKRQVKRCEIQLICFHAYCSLKTYTDVRGENCKSFDLISDQNSLSAV